MWPYFAIALTTSAIIGGAQLLGRRAPQRYGSVAIVAGYVLVGAIFCFFAGARDLFVGTDTRLYGMPAFQYVLDNGFGAFLSGGPYDSWDPLSRVLLGLAAIAARSSFWYFFIIQLFFVAPVLVTIRLVLKNSAPLGIFIFGILFFPVSLCLMRQAVAMGFVFLSFYFVQKKRPLLFVLFVVVGALFHSTAFVGLLIYPLYLIGAWERGNLPIKIGIMTAAIGCIVIIFPIVINVIAPYAGRYSGYLDLAYDEKTGWENNTYKVALLEITVFLFLSAAYCFCQKKAGKASRSKELSGVAYVVYFGAAENLIGLITSPLYRLGLFFALFAVILIPWAVKNIPNVKLRRAFGGVSVLCLSATSIVYYVVGNAQYHVFPYVMGL